ncbi:MAG: methyltransferase domain-containing protein, partial [Deltaproteobacteria bacterium]|nr:methyltransferase domain-containing protein [Deltaproteobacteria bacterium]
MSKFSEKILRGEVPADHEWAEHLIEAHKEAPSMTPNAFAPYRTAEGITSYELLARTLDGLAARPDATVLDLACGDGYLVPFILEHAGPRASVVGVDMSEGELAVARATRAREGVRFVNGRAQELPLADASIDAAVCHMAFMLMLPL